MAQLVPNNVALDRAKALSAVRRIRNRAIALNTGAFDWPEWKAYRDAGRP